MPVVPYNTTRSCSTVPTPRYIISRRDPLNLTLHFHILPTIPRIRLRMPCTGFLYSCGIISHSHVKIDYSSILPPERKWFFNSRRTSPYLLYPRGVSNHKYSRPMSNGRLYLFQYCCIGLSQPEEPTSAGYFPFSNMHKRIHNLYASFSSTPRPKNAFFV